MTDPSKYPQKEINRFDDVFHESKDDVDEDKDKYVDFDNLYQNFQTDDNDDDLLAAMQQIEENNPHAEIITEEQQLSQKLSQLSAVASGEKEATIIQDDTETTVKKRPSVTPSTPTSEMATKKIKTTEIDETADAELPRFLSRIKDIFQEAMKPLLNQAASTINIEHLRKIALIKFHIAINDLDISLWTSYLRSGTGRLEQSEPLDQQELQALTTTATTPSHLRRWPSEVKERMIRDGDVTVPYDKIDDDTCLSYVCKMLRQLRDQNTHSHHTLKDRKQQLLNSFTCEMEDTIDKFVEQHGTAFRRVPIDAQIAGVKYKYTDRLIELEFHEQNPHEYQLQTFQKMDKLKFEKEVTKMSVAILKQRLLYNHLPSSFESLHIPEPITLDTIKDATIRQRLSERYHKVLQRTKSDMLTVYIATEQAKANEQTAEFNLEHTDMKYNLRCGPIHKKLTPTMVNILQKRLKNINEYVISDGQELNVCRRSDIKKSTIGCSPTIFQNTIHHLSLEQLSFLNRGPTYVSPCQIHILSSLSTMPLNEILTKQMAPIRRQLTKVFTEHRSDLSRKMKFEEKTKELFIKYFSATIPPLLEERVLYEKQLIQSIQKQLKQNQLILRRTADNKNTYYLGQLNEYNFKANEYVQNCDFYEVIGSIDANHTEEQLLNDIIHSINLAFDKLLKQKLISDYHITKLTLYKRSNIKLPYLYFLPEINQDGSLVLQPRISSCNNSLMQTFATYLDHLLRPLFEHICRSITFENGGDFINKLQYYCRQQEFLRPTTQFITFEIQNLYTHLLHSDLLTGVHRLLVHPVLYKPHHDGAKPDGLEELVNIFLQNNVFTYNNKIYRQTKGCPLNFPLSRLLFDIYLHHWQFTLLRSVRVANEFFGLYHNTGFLTWNKSTDEIQAIFAETNRTFESSIKLINSIGSHVQYLNSYIENRNGQLYSRVYYDPIKQPFLLPYCTDHPRLLHRQWFRFALLRAGLYCSRIEDFQDEQLNIELTFLANGYSLDFTKYHLQQFFQLVDMATPEEILFDQYRYSTLRHRLFRYHTDQTRRLAQEQLWRIKQVLIQFDYLFDWGSRWEFNAHFYKNWIEILELDSKFIQYGLKIKLNSKHCYLSNTLLTK